MVRLKWDNEDSPMYQTGVSQGVFYGDDGVGHAWSGLVSVTEKPQNNAPTAVYNAMGEKYDNFGNVAEKKHGLACYIYPEVMDDYLGYEYLEDFGFTVDERPPKKFHMAYRVELGNGLYEIHVLLNQIATFGETARQTVADTSVLSTITMNLEGAVDPRLGTSHIRLDSRLPITKSAEVLLFGDQYTDANINDFLTAEPVWETVATNLAPIIDPDYDNYVWLGGKNLVTGYHVAKEFSNREYIPSSHIDRTVDSSIHIGRIYFDQSINDGDLVTIQIKGTLAPGATSLTLNIAVPDGPDKKAVATRTPGVYAVSFIWDQGESSGAYINVRSPRLGDTYIEWVKIELGDQQSPWIPNPDDSNQLPRHTDPRPANYKPGVKFGHRWDHREAPEFNTIAYYDENTNGLGVYSKLASGISTVPGQIRMRPFVISQHNNAPVRVQANVTLPKEVAPIQPGTMLAMIRLGNSNVWSNVIKNERGTHPLSLYTPLAQMNNTWTREGLSFYHSGFPESGILSYTEIIATVGGYDGEFFDVYTQPKTRGDRYVRVPDSHGDYTIHQQLRLRSTSKVKLSDITQYDFWLEAADSMLIRQNETFTFNGPQAVIDGDTFTIDDSIQGYAEG